MAVFSFVGLETDTNIIVGKDCVNPSDITGPEAPAYAVNWHFQVRGIPAGDSDMYPRNLCDGPNIWFNPSLTAGRTNNHCVNVTSGRWPLYAIRTQEVNGTYTWDMYVAPSDWPAEPLYPPIGTVYTVELYKGTQELNEMVPPDLTLTTIITSNLVPPNHEGPGDSCALGGAISHIGNDQQAGAAPLSLLRGEKREAVTDLSLTTPAGPLAFTRSYRQEQQASVPAMGLGWTHNHAIFIDDSVTNKLIVQLGNGGRAHFTYNSGLDLYEGDAGSTATIAVDSGSTNAHYTLTTADDVQYVFDNQERLRERQWPNGETWTYSYYTSGFAIGYLQEVADGYGRKLQFTYVNNSGQFDHLQLWRVGDQDATGLDGGSPAGNYVKFTYIQEYEDGTPVSSSPQPLLSEVRDVRGNTWTYRYYGYESGEDVNALFNNLVRLISPTVDVDGDGWPDGVVILKALSYSFTRELAVNGGMETDSDWTAISGAEPITNQQSTSQVDSGTYARYVEAEADAEGIEGTPWALVAGRTYTITARVYPVNSGDQVKMQVTGTAALDDTSIGDGVWETLTATYTPTVTTSGRHLQFIAVGGAADFYIDSVSIEERYPDYPAQITEQLGQFGTDPALLTMDYVFQPGTQAVTTETVAGLTTIHHFPGGVYAGVEDPAGNRTQEGLDRQYRPALQIDANGQTTALLWSMDGTQLESVTNANDETTTFTYLTDGSHRLETVEDAQGHETTYFYGDSNNPRSPTRIQVYDTDGMTVLHWQEFSYDSRGRTLTEQLIDPADGTTVLQEVTRSYYVSGPGQGLLEKVSQIDGTNDPYTEYTYDSAGRITQVKRGSAFGDCCFTLTEYDVAGNVTQVTEVRDPAQASDPELSPVTTHTYDALGRRVRTTQHAETSFAQTTLTLYDELNRVERVITHYVNPEIPETNPVEYTYAAPRGWVWDTTNKVWKDSGEVNARVIDHGSDQTQNVITTTKYNRRGLVRWQQDPLGQVTLYGYDAAGRLSKTIQNASDPDYNNHEVGTNPDPELASYPASDAPDQDIVTTQAYDANGNLIESMDAQQRVHRTIYDALNRPVMTIRNYVALGDPVTDPADWFWSTTNSQWEYDAGHAIEHGTGNDQNLIATTIYDVLGRVESTRDVNGQENRNAYDGLGHQTHTIVNYVDSASTDPEFWYWKSQVQQPDEPHWEDGLGNPIDHGAGNDQNLITMTEYDANGRVALTRGVLGNATHYAYDGLGRQTSTIVNYVDGSYSLTVSDEDLISQTVYDANSRVVKTVDPRGNVTLYGYDDQGRQVKTIQNASNDTYNVAGDSDLSDYTPAMGVEVDQDRITSTTYDDQGRVAQTTDPAGSVTHFVYDLLGRRVKSIVNYVTQGDPVADPDGWVWSETNSRWEYSESDSTPIDHGTAFDQNLVSQIAYDLAGRVIATRDVRGTQTAFTYDGAGRRLTMTQAAGTGLETTHYTCYDKAGQILRTIQNWVSSPEDPSPDEQVSGSWLFAPTVHGMYDDENLITEYQYDAAGRRVSVIDPLGNTTQTAYFKDGQVDTLTDPEDVVTAYRYDQVRRRTLVVQNYEPDYSSGTYADPDSWLWKSDAQPDPRWEDGTGIGIDHDPDQDGNADVNVIVQVVYDRAGRMRSLLDPRGNETTYDYDRLGRRTKRTNPLALDWTTAYSDSGAGGASTKLTDPNGIETRRDFDRLGRLVTLDYNLLLGDTPPFDTLNVGFTYDAAGNRVRMSEDNGNVTLRETHYSYDAARRLTSVGFDNDGDSMVDEAVAYEYDAGGLRTKLTLPGGTDSIVYVYNAKGELVSLTDWDDQDTHLAYDNAGRHIATLRANGLRSRYHYDAASRLRLLRHTKDFRTLGHFAYEVDGRGNRVQALELLPHPATTNDVTIAWDDAGVVYRGNWTDDAVNGFKATGSISASLQLMFYGTTASLTFGVGPDHSIFDVYIGKTLWESFDGYAASPGERTVDIPLDAAGGKRLTGEGPHLLELRNRVDRNSASGGNMLRFKQLVIPDVAYDLHTIQYTYDKLSRLQQANYDSGDRIYDFNYDMAGNRLAELLSGTGVTPTNRYFGYNAANQLVAEGDSLDMAGDVVADYTYEYDANGNLLYKKDITPTTLETYTWDRANRLLTAPGSTSYQYDGNGNRIQQTVSSVVTDYLLDMQPGLAVVLQQTTNSNVDRFIHGPRGIHAQQDNGGDWFYPLQDGLGSVRGVADSVLSVQGMQHYEPYGTPFGAQGSLGMPFGFTGEQTDANDLVYLRARYLSPGLGVFASLDAFEGMAGRPMSLNGYSWVEGRVVNLTDAIGLCPRPLDEVSRIQSFECENMRNQLSGWGVNVTYDAGTNVLDAQSLCIPEQCERAVNQAQSINQRFTLGEMESIYNAVRIFRTGKTTLRFNGLNSTITIQKKREAGTVNDLQKAALGFTTGRTITLSAKWWGQGQRQSNEGEYTRIVNGEEVEIRVNSIDSFARDPQQYRSWIVLHEMGHVLLRDLGFDDNDQDLKAQDITDAFGRLFPTQYSFGRRIEYLIEAVTGTIWNAGYSTIAGYDASGGGRTTLNTYPEYFNSTLTFQANIDDDEALEDLSVVNVRLISSNGRGTLAISDHESNTLENWVIANILRGSN